MEGALSGGTFFCDITASPRVQDFSTKMTENLQKMSRKGSP